MDLGISWRLLAAMAIAAVAGLGGGVAAVGAHDVTHDQTVGYVTGTATTPGEKYKVRGDVGSLGGEKCEVGRTVRFVRDKIGQDQPKGTDVTDGKGEFKFVFPNGLKMAMYYLRVARLVLKSTAAHHHVCAGSKTSPFSAGNNP
jgi:hypothetical protein